MGLQQYECNLSGPDWIEVSKLQVESRSLPTLPGLCSPHGELHKDKGTVLVVKARLNFCSHHSP